MSAEMSGDDPAFGTATLERMRETLTSGVGYGRPPKDRQFKKGQSGNPNGRPKKVRSAPVPASLTEHDKAVLAEMARTETVVEGGKRIRISRQELVLRAQSAAAVKGNALAQRNALAMAAEAEARAAAKAAQDKDKAEEAFQWAKALKARQQANWDALLRTGELFFDPYPRPEDILLDWDNRTYEIRGPYCSDNLPHYVSARLYRDRALLQWATACPSRPAYEKWLAVQWLLFDALNRTLPLAWQLDELHAIVRASHYTSMTEKQLDIEEEIMMEMEALLQLPVSAKPDTGSRKLDAQFERGARKRGHASFGAMINELEKSRQGRLTRAIKQKAHDRLEALFKIDIAAERRRAARNAELEAKRPLYEQRRVVVA